MRYYVYDLDGCAYHDSIAITNHPIKRGRFIAECATAHEANIEASKYLYDVNRDIELSYDAEYYERSGGYPPYDEDEDFFEFINEYDDDDDEDDDYEDDDYEDDDEEW